MKKLFCLFFMFVCFSNHFLNAQTELLVAKGKVVDPGQFPGNRDHIIWHEVSTDAQYVDYFLDSGEFLIKGTGSFRIELTLEIYEPNTYSNYAIFLGGERVTIQAQSNNYSRTLEGGDTIYVERITPGPTYYVGPETTIKIYKQGKVFDANFCTETVVEPNTNFKLCDIIVDNPNINYSQATGVITFLKAGLYTIDLKLQVSDQQDIVEVVYAGNVIRTFGEDQDQNIQYHFQVDDTLYIANTRIPTMVTSGSLRIFEDIARKKRRPHRRRPCKCICNCCPAKEKEHKKNERCKSR